MSRPRLLAARLLALVPLLPLFLAACEHNDPASPIVLASITVTPDPRSLSLGATQAFIATGRDEDGDLFAITPVWSVVQGGGTIDASTGLFTAGMTAGTFANTVQASFGGMSGLASVTVTGPGQLASIVITPNPGGALVSGPIQFVAEGRDAAGTVVTMSPAVTWSVVSGGGTINPTTGLFAGGATAGTFSNTIRATSGAVSGTATVTLTNPDALGAIVVTPNPGVALTGGTIQFSAEGRSLINAVIPISPAVTWSVVSGGGTINSTTGLFTAGATTGTFASTVRATSGGLSGFATVIVTAPGQLASIVVTPNPGTALTGGMITFSAEGRDATGAVVAISPAVTWSVVAGGGTINPTTGLFTGGPTAGIFTNTIRATSGALSGSATVILTLPGQLASIVVTPNPGSALTGAMITFSAEGRDATGAVVAISPAVTWSVVAGGGTIDPTTGLFTGGPTAGTFTNTIRATSGALSGSASVILTLPGQLASIVVIPNPGAALVGGTVQFTAEGHDATGAIVAISPAVVWSVVAGGGTINVTTGLFTAGATTGTFTNTIRATSGSIAGFATVTVTAPAPLASIVVTPNPGTALAGGTIQFSAEGRNASGTIVPITPAVTWSVVAGGGTINSTTGLFTAGVTTGTHANTVQATSGTVSGFATVTVTAPGQLASIVVTPNPGSALVGGMMTFSAEGRDATGAIVTITPAVTWSVVAGGGTIDGVTGEFTAGATAGTFFNTVRAASGTVSGFATAIVTATPPPGPSLGTAQTYGILAGSTVTCVTGGTINASVAVSTGTTIAGFPPCTISGETHLGDAVAATAKNDLSTAYNELAGLPCGTVVTPADVGGRTLAPGVYCVATSMGVTGTVTLDGQGDPNARFVFQIGSTLTTGTIANIALINGAMAKNVWWQVGSSATIGTGTTFRGNILALVSITLNDNATMLGRAFAQNGAVTLGTNNTVSLP